MLGIKYATEGSKEGFPVVFGHGWARDHRDFIPVAELIGDRARSILIDFPGFGDSPRPKETWDTEQYALSIQSFLRNEFGITRFIWVGHSFGGRVGLRLGCMKDSPLDHLLIVAGAGVPRRVSQFQRIRSYWRSWLFKQRKSRVRTDEELNLLERKFGSPDYIESRKIGMRDIFIKTVQEDQSAKLKRIDCPTTLIYGSQDIETPPEIGMRLKDLIPNSSYIECPEFDHHSILSRGRHQLALTLREVLRDSA